MAERRSTAQDCDDTGGSGSSVSSELIEAYRATHYRVDASAPFTLHIDEPSPELARLYRASGHACAAFISACNPLSVPHSAAFNAAAHAQLREALDRRGVRFIEGAGVDAKDGWREQSVLALGIAVDIAQEIGRAFEQNAILWIGEDAVPRLCLLR